MRIALIVKPIAPAAMDALRTGVDRLRKAGHRVRVFVTFEADDVARFTRLACRQGFDLLVAAGGDGTLNELINQVMRSGSRTRVAVVPLGTANDFAKGVGMPADAAAALEVVLHGVERELDVAMANHRYFINVSTGGFGPDITDAASKKTKRRFGRLAYALEGLRKLPALSPHFARFTSEGELLYDGPFFFFAVGNARQTGGGTQVTPCADFRDAHLDVAIVTGTRRRDFLTLLPDLRAGRHVDDPDVIYIRTRTLAVMPRDSIVVNIDGESIEGDSYDYRIAGRLPFILPR